MDSVYLARPLWRHISRYADALRCLKCELPADYVQAVIVPGPSVDKPCFTISWATTSGRSIRA